MYGLTHDDRRITARLASTRMLWLIVVCVYKTFAAPFQPEQDRYCPPHPLLEQSVHIPNQRKTHAPAGERVVPK
jgi:hypothetical protein